MLEKKKKRGVAFRMAFATVTAAPTPHQMDALEEYVAVLEPVAKAINFLESEKQMYMGYLQPTIRLLMSRLQELHRRTTPLSYFSVAPDYLAAQITRRFHGVLTDPFYDLATAFHPSYKLDCLDFEDRSRVRELMVAEVDKVIAADPELSAKASYEEAGLNAEDDHPDVCELRSKYSLSSSQNQSLTTVDADTAVAQYLEERRSLSAMRSPLMRALFLKFNTGLPSSAPVERMFSLAKNLLRCERSRMSDEHVDRSLFLKANRRLLQDKS